MNTGRHASFCPDIQTTVTVSISGTTARTAAALLPGLYRITSDVNCFIQPGGSTIEATTVKAPLWYKTYDYHAVSATTNNYIAAITAGETGTLYVTKV